MAVGTRLGCNNFLFSHRRACWAPEAHVAAATSARAVAAATAVAFGRATPGAVPAAVPKAVPAAAAGLSRLRCPAAVLAAAAGLSRLRCPALLAAGLFNPPPKWRAGRDRERLDFCLLLLGLLVVDQKPRPLICRHHRPAQGGVPPTVPWQARGLRQAGQLDGHARVFVPG